MQKICCSEEFIAYFSCSRNKLTTPEVTACYDDCLLANEPNSTDCGELKADVCSLLDFCTACAPCREELRFYLECIYQELSDPICTGFSCPPLTGLPTPSPTIKQVNDADTQEACSTSKLDECLLSRTIKDQFVFTII